MAADERNEEERTDEESAPERASRRDERPGGARGGRPRFRRDSRRRGRVCQFCVEKIDSIDYKDVPLLRQLVSERGRILPRRRTGTCAKHQRMVSRAVKRARHLAMLPYTGEHVRITRS